MKQETFNTIMAFAVFTMLILMMGLGSHFIDGIGVN